MRICLISREYPPDTGWGGIGAYTYQHARALKQLGHDVEVVALCKKEQSEAPGPINDDGIIVHRCPWGPLLEELSTLWISAPYSHYVLKCSLALWHKFSALHAARPYDVVEAPEHLAEALFPALTHVCPLVLRLHTPHSKFIKEKYHNLSAGQFDQELVAILERTAILEADLLSSPSEDLARFVASDCGFPTSEISIVRNPVDTVRFQPEGDKAIAGGDKVTVFFAGRLEERKGVHFIVDAIPQVLAKTKNVQFVIVGADTNTGPGKTSVLKELQARLQASGSTEYVRFINHVNLTEMPNYYRSADICLVPSLYENAPYTVLEAMATGKPVIGSAAGGTPEYVQDGLTGTVVPAANAQALAQAIIELVIDTEKRQRYASTARRFAIDHFDRLKIAEEAVETYMQAIEKHSQKALYRRPQAECLENTVRLLHSYHRSLCQLIYVHSFTYRARYWWQQLTVRPKLTLARAAASTLKPFASKGQLFRLVESLEQKIADSQALTNEVEIQALMAKFQCHAEQETVCQV